MWFKNRRAKFRKKQRSLQKEQLQRQKEAGTETGQEAEKGDTPPTTASESQTPPPNLAEGNPAALAPPVEHSEEVNVTSPEQSGAESGPEDLTDREDEPPCFRGDVKAGPQLPGESSPPCKPLSPKSGMFKESPYDRKHVKI